MKFIEYIICAFVSLVLASNVFASTESDLQQSNQFMYSAYQAVQNGNVEEAERLAQKAIEYNPENDNAYLVLGGIYGDMKNDYEKGTYFFKKAIEINNKNETAYFGLALIYYETGDLGKAKEALKKVFSVTEPGHPMRASAEGLLKEIESK